MPTIPQFPVSMSKRGKNPAVSSTTLLPEVLAPSSAHRKNDDSQNADNAQTEFIRLANETHEYWDSIVTKEPISEELKAWVREDLKEAWYYHREATFREYTKTKWATLDSYRITLGDTVPADGVEREKLGYICNKPTAFYWMQSAQGTDAYGERCLTPSIIFAAIYQEWFRCCNAKPNVEFGHFFANPIRITSTGPSTVRGVIDAHRSISGRASRLINESFEGRADFVIERHPSSQEHFSIFPLYHAIVVILDDFDPGFELDSDGFISLRAVARYQTVLVARTGVEKGLSAPISFESLKSQSLPLGRSDVSPKTFDVVRVPLATAMQFILDLEAREGIKVPQETRIFPPTPKGFQGNDHIYHCPEAWADACLKAAEEHGYDNVRQTYKSIRRVLARRAGQKYLEFSDLPLGNDLK